MKRSDRIRLGVRASSGQTAIEYLSLIAVVVAVVGAIVATGIGGSLFPPCPAHRPTTPRADIETA
ncbi:hypothetical protein [Streptomyces sp. SM13]|uniref:hypothetical protein n=1 Tax=Streptomyces sp. SM13 TaxID=1983803 RepID=UPI000CD4E1F2|nr:hypothetical protein [Streptomyces sp. SM13]